MALDKHTDGMHLFLMDDTGILFSEACQEIHILNTTATVIWCHLEDEKSADEIASTLVETFGLSLTDAEHYVTTALVEWRRQGFLAGDNANRPVAAASGEPPTKPELPEWTDSHFVAERSYRLLSSHLRLRFTRPEHEAIVHPIFAHLEQQEDGSVPETLIDIIATPQGIVLYRDKEAKHGFYKIDALVPIAKSTAWFAAILGQNFFLDIHAGVVRDKGGCILLCAPAGSGKSTMTAALVSAGFQYFSDELAMLEEETFNVFPAPLALCFKDTGFDAIERYFPQVRTLPVHIRGDGKRVCYMPPPADAMPTVTTAQPIKAVVFPSYQSDALTTLDRLEPLDALKLLMDQCLVINKRLDKEKVAGMIDWITRMNSYRLVYSNTEEAVARIKAL